VSEYLLEFCDSRFAGSGRTVYRLLIGAVPFAVEAFPMAMPRGQSAAVELRGGTLSGDRIFALRTPADPLPAMFWPTIPARLLGETDDGKVAPGRRGGGGGGGRARAPVAIDPAFDLTMPAGQRAVKLVVKDLMARGGAGFTYRVVVQPVETAFQVVLTEDHVAVPRGGTALIPVTVTRGGYNGPIALDVRGGPVNAGVRVLPGIVPAGQGGGVVGLEAAADSTFEVRDVQVVGKGEDGHAVAASRTIVFAEQTVSPPGFGMAGTIPSYARPFVSLTATVIQPGPFRLHPQATKLVMPQGGTVVVPVQVVRPKREKAKYTLAALAPPTGLSAADSEIGETATSVAIRIMAATDAPLGPHTVALAARAPTKSGTAATRRGAAAATSKGAAPQATPLAVAAAIIIVEVVRRVQSP